MTELLLRLFVPNASLHTPDVHARIGKLAGIVGIVCNVFLACLKLVVGLASGSVAIAGDGINNLTDSASSIVTLLGFRMAQRPADEEHPFGHGRYEYISGVVVAALVLLAGTELAKSSFEKILSPESVPFSILTVSILLVSVVLKLWMAFFNRKLGRMIHSATLEATAQDSRNDIIATSAVLLSFLADGLWHIQLDGYVGLGVACFIPVSYTHLAAGLVTEVNTGLQQLLHRYDSHFSFLLLLFPPPRSSRAARPKGAHGGAIPGCVVLIFAGKAHVWVLYPIFLWIATVFQKFFPLST